MRHLLLVAALIIFWGALSQPTQEGVPQILIALAVSLCITMTISMRMKIVDEEGQPTAGFLKLGTYIPWLMWQIVLSNIGVLKVVWCWNPKTKINPTVVEIPHSLHSGFAKVIYANSITLTPGTVTIRVGNNHMLVHSLTQESAIDLQNGEMHRHVKLIEGEA